MTIPVTLTQRGWGRDRCWEARVGELVAHGKTRTQAKHAVEALALAALSGDATPRLLRVPGSPLLLLVWREPLAGWCEKVVCDAPSAPPKPERLWGSAGHGSPADAERGGRRHLAQLVYGLHGPAAAFSVLPDAADRSELAAWIGFQRAHQAAVMAGEADPHSWAGEHAREHIPQIPAAT